MLLKIYIEGKPSVSVVPVGARVKQNMEKQDATGQRIVGLSTENASQKSVCDEGLVGFSIIYFLCPRTMLSWREKWIFLDYCEYWGSEGMSRQEIIKFLKSGNLFYVKRGPDFIPKGRDVAPTKCYDDVLKQVFCTWIMYEDMDINEPKPNHPF